MEFWVILLGLAALALAVYLLIINFMEGLAVFCHDLDALTHRTDTSFSSGWYHNIPYSM